jgi:hypothetical protein
LAAATKEPVVQVVDLLANGSSSLLSSDSDSEDTSISELPALDDDDDTEEIEEGIGGLLDVVSVKAGNGKRRRLDVDTKVPVAPFIASSSSSVGRAIANHTLIIFDWDDTLLPSSWLLQQGLKIAPNSKPPNDEQKEVLSRVAQHVVRTLSMAKRAGTVIIITNAEKGWVELTSRHFLPAVVPLLEGIKVLSARSTFEPNWPAHPIKWKSLAFYNEIVAFYAMARKQYAEGYRENVMSIGDSMHEREALIEATELRDCWTKSIKFLDAPSPAHLSIQHRLLRTCLPTLVELDDNADLCLRRGDLPVVA